MQPFLVPQRRADDAQMRVGGPVIGDDEKAKGLHFRLPILGQNAFDLGQNAARGCAQRRVRPV